MRPEICTLFDRRYLSRGLALYRSLMAHGGGYRLWAFCMDAETKAALEALGLPGLVPISLAELEAHDPGLLAVKSTRTPTEYFWTLMPATCLYVLDREPAAEAVIRVDADVSFHADPSLALAELDGGSVLLTPHRIAPQFADSLDFADWAGIFNVQFEVFRRDETGLAALRWWRARCIEWCYDRFEPSRYGDQKYLNELPRRFAGVHVLEHPGAGLAPWNVSAHRLERRGELTLVDGRPLIFHHYQSLEVHPATHAARWLAKHASAYRLTDDTLPLVWTTGWRLRERELALLWEPYVRSLGRATADLREVLGPHADPPAIRWRRAAFQIGRRRLPPWARDAYWRAWELKRLLRSPRLDQSVAEPGAHSRAAAATSSTSASDSSG